MKAIWPAARVRWKTWEMGVAVTLVSIGLPTISRGWAARGTMFGIGRSDWKRLPVDQGVGRWDDVACSCGGLTGGLNLSAEQSGDFVDILIAASREANHNDVGFVSLPCRFEDMGDRMGGFHGGDDPLISGKCLKGVEGFGVRSALVGDAARVLPVTVLRTDSWVVEPRGDRVDKFGLAIVILQNIAKAAMEDSGTAIGERAGMLAAFGAPAAGLDSHEGDSFVLNEGVKHSSGV